ncbi:MAG: ATP-binding protein [Candidatus Magnetomorum sp.]|nr:ATP-binding protein [Candidatus Magnetomorum sp.]
MLERFSEKKLKQWYHKKNRKPLVLRGARQVGKSTLVRQFALKNNIVLHEINLEQHMDMDKIFQTLNIERIIQEIEALVGANIQQPGMLLFLDEIQATPHAIAALRYFYEQKKHIAVISAGSLLEFSLSNQKFSMPVGRLEYTHIGPMTFKEFLNAVDPVLNENIASYDLNTNFSIQSHKKLLARQREYMFTGGMPEAVMMYQESESLTDVFDIHRSIVETYQDDFSKYAQKNELALMQRVFRYIPRYICTKVKYSNISQEYRANTIKAILDLFEKARICHKVYHSPCAGIPLYADIEERIYKLIFMDIGIVNHICGNDWITIQSLIDTQLVNEGPLAEQFIGQHLILLNHMPPRLCYWLREKKVSNAELDYVISQGNLIVPVEVKSGKSGSLKSLQQFIAQKKLPFAVRFDLNMPSLQNIQHQTITKTGKEMVSFDLLSLPLYMVEEMPRLVDQYRQAR